MTDETTLRQISVDELGLSARAQNILHRADKHTVFELLSCTEEELSRIKGVGTKTVREILQKIDEYRQRVEADAVPAAPDTTPASEEDRINAAIDGKTIDVLDLPARGYNILRLSNKTALDAVLFLPEEELQELPYMDRRTAREICRCCREYLSELREMLQQEDTAQEQQEVNIHDLIDLPQYRELVLEYVRVNDEPVIALGLSQRAENQLQRNGYRMLSDVLFAAPSELKALRNMGATSVQSVIDGRRRWVEKHAQELRAVLTGEKLPLQEDSRVCKQILKLYETAPDAGFGKMDFSEKLPGIQEDQWKRCVGKLLAEGKLEYVDFRCYRVYPRFIDAVRTCPDLTEKQRTVAISRLEGARLDEAAQGLSRQRADQIMDKLVKVRNWNLGETGMDRFDEDYYRYLYENYKINWRDNAIQTVIPKEARYYLNLVAKKGTKKLDEAAYHDKNLSASLKQRIRNYLNRDKIFLDGIWLPQDKDPLMQFVVTQYCKEDISFEDFCTKYNDLLDSRQIPNDKKIYITESDKKYIKNRLMKQNYLLWKQGETLRAYDIDGEDFAPLLDELGLAAYENIELSTQKFVNEHPELMKRYDIRDRYELHNLLRKIVPEGSYHNITFTRMRMPNIRFGEFDQDAALREMMIDHAPISQTDLVDLIYQEYGYDRSVVSSTYLRHLKEYYHNGEYSIEQKVMPDSRREQLLAALDGDFFFLDELNTIYQEKVPGADPEEINPFNLTRMGFKVLSRYVLRNYDSLESFFRAILTENEVTELAPLRRRYCYIMAFSNTLSELRQNLDVIEYEPGTLIRIDVLESDGVTKEDLLRYCDAVDCFVQDGAWFSVASLRSDGFTDPLYEKLGPTDDWFFGSVLSADKRFRYAQLFKNLILHKGDGKVTSQAFETALISAADDGSIDKYDLQCLLEEKYGCTVDDPNDLVYRVADSGVYYDRYLDRFYDSEARYWDEVNETEDR